MSTTILRRFIKEILEKEEKKPLRKLRVFDFDDTLVKTASMIHATNAKGEKFDLTPGEYAVYEPQLGDIFDYSDFSKLINPKEIKWTVRILRNILTAGSEAVILTARGDSAPVEEFIRDASLPVSQVIALGTSDPQAKAAYIESRIKDGVNVVEFFDDSAKNIEAVKLLRNKYPRVKIITRHIAH